MPKSSVALVAILTFWLGWPGETQAHVQRGKSPEARSPFASSRRLSGMHFPGGCPKTRSRDWPVLSLRVTLSLASLDDLIDEEFEDGEGDSTEGYGLGVMPVFCGMIDEIGWQLALLLSPEAVAFPRVRAVLRC